MTPFFECTTPGFNGSVVELKEATTKVMRALRTLESATLDGQRVYYNHIRPHQALNGKTPAEAAGLESHIDCNKWERLIKKAANASTQES
jgi:hypothetical protein